MPACPSLFKFLTILAVLAGIAYGGMIALGNIRGTKTRGNDGSDSRRQGESAARVVPMTSSPALIEAFLEMMAAERGASENTLSAYRLDLDDAGASCGDKLADAGPDVLRRYLESIAGRGFAASTQARKLSALRQFFRFLYAEGYRDDDPTGQIDGPRKQPSLPKVLSVADVTALIDLAAREVGVPDMQFAARMAALRLHALIEVLYATGMRVSELVSLPAAVARRDERYFVVRGKGSKERMVPLSAIGARCDDFMARMSRFG